MQDQIASRVVGVIEPRLRLIENDRVSRKPTESLDAYDLYLRAMAENYKMTKEAAAESIRLARRALELDPAFAPAMARIAGSRHMQLMRHWIPASGKEIDEGIQMARQALAATRDNPEVLRLAGLALAALAGDNETALNALDRAIELNPNYALAYAQRGLVLSWLNRPDEAIAAAERAIRLSPNDPTVFPPYHALCLAHLAAGRYEEAFSWADRALAANTGPTRAAAQAEPLRLSWPARRGERMSAAPARDLSRANRRRPDARWSKGTSTEVADRIAEGLRKAGLPEE